MKTISKEGNVLRVEDEIAEQKVKTGWNYAPKSLWKEQVRNPTIKEKEEAEKRRQEEKKERTEKTKQEQGVVKKKFQKGNKND